MMNEPYAKQLEIYKYQTVKFFLENKYEQKITRRFIVLLI